MNTNNFGHSDDEEFEAFLQGKGPVAELLQQLPQPNPPADLEANILRKLKNLREEELASKRAPVKTAPAANDPWFPKLHGLAARALSLQSHFPHGMRVPLAAAASVMVAVIAGVMLSSHNPEEYGREVAQAPIQASPPKEALPKEELPREALPKETSSKERTIQVAQNDISESYPGNRGVLGPRVNGKNSSVSDIGVHLGEEQAPAPAASVDVKTAAGVVSPQVSVEGVKKMAAAPGVQSQEPAKPAVDATASAPTHPEAPQWLEKIEGLVTAGKSREALAEWTEFRKVFPNYTVAEKLTLKIKSLKSEGAEPAPPQK